MAARPPPQVVPSRVTAIAVSPAQPANDSTPPIAARAVSTWSRVPFRDGSHVIPALMPDQSATSAGPAWRPSNATSVPAGRRAAIALAESFGAKLEAGAPDGTGATLSLIHI